MKHLKIGATFLAAIALTACGSQQSTTKDSYSFYLAERGTSFSQPNGTLDGGGYLNVTFMGETFTGRNANNKIEAKGDKGNTLNCAYEMPNNDAVGTCKLSNGKTLDMKFQ